MGVLLWSLVVAALLSTTLSAQTLPPPKSHFEPMKLTAGICTVVVAVAANPAPGGSIEIDINGFGNQRQEVKGQAQIKFKLPGPLQHLDRVRLREVGPAANSDWSAPLEVQPASTAKPECERETERLGRGDGRDPFQASGYVGYVFDNFAPAEIGGYKVGTLENPGDQKKNRYIAGVDFEFRMFGSPDDDRQWWIVGETLHGVRSADVDCSTDPAPAVCGDLKKDPSARLLYTFREASSFEAFIASPRFEFMTLQRGTVFPSKLYATMRFGVMMLNGKESKGFHAHHFGIGLLSPSGPFHSSYLEVGWGKTDLFFTEPGRGKWHRLKIDGLLSFPLLAPLGDKAPRVFVQLYSDFDPVGNSADSVQTFVGLDFNIGELFRF
jgi:hypothetical protein